VAAAERLGPAAAAVPPPPQPSSPPLPASASASVGAAAGELPGAAAAAAPPPQGAAAAAAAPRRRRTVTAAVATVPAPRRHPPRRHPRNHRRRRCSGQMAEDQPHLHGLHPHLPHLLDVMSPNQGHSPSTGLFPKGAVSGSFAMKLPIAAHTPNCLNHDELEGPGTESCVSQ
jgi:hypothetical protein